MPSTGTGTGQGVWSGGDGGAAAAACAWATLVPSSPSSGAYCGYSSGAPGPGEITSRSQRAAGASPPEAWGQPPVTSAS